MELGAQRAAEGRPIEDSTGGGIAETFASRPSSGCSWPARSV